MIISLYDFFEICMMRYELSSRFLIYGKGESYHCDEEPFYTRQWDSLVSSRRQPKKHHIRFRSTNEARQTFGLFSTFEVSFFLCNVVVFLHTYCAALYSIALVEELGPVRYPRSFGMSL